MPNDLKPPTLEELREKMRVELQRLRATMQAEDALWEELGTVKHEGRELFVRRLETLGGGHAHVYVTRSATLEFCALTHLHFEESRRTLTRLLLAAEPVPGDRRRWTFRVGMPTSPERVRRPELGPALYTLVAYIVPDGDLLVVANVALAQDARDAYDSGPPRDDGSRGPAPGVYSPAQLK